MKASFLGSSKIEVDRTHNSRARVVADLHEIFLCRKHAIMAVLKSNIVPYQRFLPNMVTNP